jgi:diguanylate cyclase
MRLALDAGQFRAVHQPIVAVGLGPAAVAEGVQTAEQAEALHRLGYRRLQGHYFGRPVAEPDFVPARATAAAL